MSLLKMKKRWYLLIIVLLVIGGSAAVRINHAQQNRALASAKIATQVYRQVDLDLIRLENVATTKVTPVQAKEMLPLVQKLSTTTDPNTQTDLAKQVYGMLTPAQYAVLTDSSTNQPNKGTQNGRDTRGMKQERGAKGHDIREGGGFYGKSYQDPKEQALGSLVIKMLNDRSAEQAQPKV